MAKLKKHDLIQIDDEIYIVSQTKKNSVCLYPISDFLDGIELNSLINPVVDIPYSLLRSYTFVDRDILLCLVSMNDKIVMSAVKDYIYGKKSRKD